MRVGPHAKWPSLLSDFNQNWNVLTNINKKNQQYNYFYKNLFNESGVLSCAQTDDRYMEVNGPISVIFRYKLENILSRDIKWRNKTVSVWTIYVLLYCNTSLHVSAPTRPSSEG
jgi:hypothetical protein